MAQVVIENPVLNSPYEEPERHFRFAEDGITDEIVEGRRSSAYYVPIPPPKKRGRQLALDIAEMRETVKPNKLVNDVRERVARWRQGGYVGITNTTRQLLDYWQRGDREKKLFFCQIEALETAIFITAVAILKATRGLRTNSARPTMTPTRSSPASPSRWRPPLARPSSWRCSSPGTP